MNNKMYNILLSIIIIIFNIVIYIVGKDIHISSITLVFSAIVFVSFYIYTLKFQIYMQEILEDLSNMLGSIEEMKETIVYGNIDDTMFSKLQHQTIRIVKILKRQNTEIAREKEEIKSLVSDIAHQIKTPLTNIKMYNDFLEDTTLTNDERKEFSEIIIYSLNKLMFLVESMIKISRLESGVIQLTKRNLSINDTILLGIKQVYKTARSKDIDIIFHPKEQINLNHDGNWTGEALFNILENAVKYSNNNTKVIISIEKYEVFVRVNISDQAGGISEEDIPKLFKRFYRGKNSEDIEGVGIGLYLTREIITKQGGYIKVNSNGDKSTFSVFLPI